MSGAELKHRLAAILAADAAGYSRLMAADEEATVAALEAARLVFKNWIEGHQGRVIDMAGDSVLAVFDTASGAVNAALAIQMELESSADPVAEIRRMHFRIGVHLGDVIEKADGTIYGDGVNVAARLQALAEPGGVAVSGVVQEAVRDRIAAGFEDQGEHTVKNIARPVHVFRLKRGARGEPAAQHPLRLRHWLVPALLAAALIVAAAFFALPGPAPNLRSLAFSLFGPAGPGLTAARASVAVLPFASVGEKDEYFADGITGDFINALGRFSDISVIAHNAVRDYRGREAGRGEIGRELGVRYLVRGSVRRAEGKLRVTVELSDAERGVLLWAERYDGEGKDVFDIQDRIVRDIVGKLAVKVARLEQARVFSKPAGSLEAYDLVLRARELINLAERKANREAREMLARAIRLAPNYAEPYLALAEAEFQRASLGWLEHMDEGVRASGELASQALSIDDPGAHARAHALLGRMHAFFQNYDLALAEADRAIEKNASDAVAHALRGAVLLWLGRIEESIASLERARQFDPRVGADSGYNLSLAWYTLGRYPEAIAVAESFLARYPRYVFLHAVRAGALAQIGQAAEAGQAAGRVRELSPFFQVELFGTGFVRPEHQAKAQEGLRKAGL